MFGGVPFAYVFSKPKIIYWYIQEKYHHSISKGVKKGIPHNPGLKDPSQP